MASDKNRLVWSDELGGSVKSPSRQAPKATATGPVRVSRQTKGRKGKGVTQITGLSLGDAELKALAKQLKQRCATGGTVKEGVIEIQGDHRDLLVQELQRLGYAAKGAGG